MLGSWPPPSQRKSGVTGWGCSLATWGSRSLSAWILVGVQALSEGLGTCPLASEAPRGCWKASALQRGQLWTWGGWSRKAREPRPRLHSTGSPPGQAAPRGVGALGASASRGTHLLSAFTPVRGRVLWPLALCWQMSRTASAFQSKAADMSLVFEKALSCLLTDAVSPSLETPAFCLGHKNARALS